MNLHRMEPATWERMLDAMDEALSNASAVAPTTPFADPRRQMMAWPTSSLPLPPDGSFKPLTQGQIRVLRLHPAATADEPLRADLLPLDLMDDGSSYEAISYTWGSVSRELVPLVCNSLEWSVTPNLGAALRNLRHFDQVRTLWTDALCIHQANAVEKGKQVAGMHKVFGRAERVLVWLGDSTTGMSLLLHFLGRVGEELGGLPPPAKSGERWWCDAMIEYVHKMDKVRMGLDEEDQWSLLYALLGLCCRPWVRRVWVRQEIFYADEVAVRCGQHELSFEQFQLCSRFLQHMIEIPTHQDGRTRHARYATALQVMERYLQPLMSLRYVVTEAARLLPEERAALSSGSRPSWDLPPKRLVIGDESQVPGWTADLHFERVLLDARNLEASDERDYIYGMLNMTYCPLLGMCYASKGGGLGMHIDYTSSVCKVFQDATKFVLNRDRSLAIFTEYKSQNDSTWPSWCINWLRDDIRTNQYLRAVEPWPLKWQDPEAEGTLVLQGIIVGVVGDVMKNWQYPGRLKYNLSMYAYPMSVDREATGTSTRSRARVEAGAVPVDTSDAVCDGDILIWVEGFISGLVSLRCREDGQYVLKDVGQLGSAFGPYVRGLLGTEGPIRMPDGVDDLAANGWRRAAEIFEATKEHHQTFRVR